MTDEELRIKVEQEKLRLTPVLRNHPYGLLLQRYFEHRAQDFTIKNNYPQAVFEGEINED